MFSIGPKKEKPALEFDIEREPAAPSLSSMASKRAAKGVLAAIESGDPAALDSALKAHYEACEGDGGEAETETEDEE